MDGLQALIEAYASQEYAEAPRETPVHQADSLQAPPYPSFSLGLEETLSHIPLDENRSSPSSEDSEGSTGNASVEPGDGLQPLKGSELPSCQSETCLKKRKRNLADLYMLHNGVPMCDWCASWNQRLKELRTATDVLYGFRPVATVGYFTQAHEVRWQDRKMVWKVWTKSGKEVYATRTIPGPIVRRVEADDDVPIVKLKKKIIKVD